jgi:small GTP-binding protein
MSFYTTRLQKKVCLLGDFGVGKTSLVHRYVYNIFSDRYLSTIGVKISRKELEVNGLQVNLLIWDLAGGEDPTEMHNGYVQGAAAALVVCDLTRADTLQAIPKHLTLLRQKNRNIPVYVLGNKVDLTEEREISDEALGQAAQEWQTPFWVTSAKTGENVAEVFQKLAEELAPPIRKAE